MNTDVRKALDAMATALDNEEFDAVEKVCRAVLREAKGGLTPIGLENEARSYLLSALFGVFGTNNLSERAERMLIREIDLQCDRLFTGYLSVRDKKSASNLLLRKRISTVTTSMVRTLLRQVSNWLICSESLLMRV